MKTAELQDLHPGKHNEGVRVYLCRFICSHGMKYLTGVRTDDSPLHGMFGPNEGPVQALQKRKSAYFLSMTNLGIITEQERQRLLREGSIQLSCGKLELL